MSSSSDLPAHGSHSVDMEKGGSRYKQTQLAMLVIGVVAIAGVLDVILRTLKDWGWLSNPTEDGIETLVACVLLAMLAYVAWHTRMSPSVKRAFVVFLVCALASSILDTTDELDFLATTPLLGANSALNGDIKALCASASGCGLLLVWYFSLQQLGAAREQLAVEAELLSDEIRARKATETAHRESEERFRLAFESGPLGMVFVNLDHTMFKVNPAFAKMLGYAPEELVGKSIAEITHPDDILSSSQLLQRLASTAKPCDAIEKRYLTQQGELFWGRVTATILCDQGGQPLFHLGLIENIDERRRAEETLRLTQFAMANMSDAVYLFGQDGRFAYVNEAAVKALGYSRDELLTLGVSEIDPHYPPDKLAATMAEIQRRTSMTFESEHRAKDGRVFPVEITANYLKFKEDEYTCAFSRDITDRKRAEEQVRRLTLDLEHASRLSIMGEMAAGVAHEIHQPMAVIANYANGCKIRLKQGNFSVSDGIQAMECVSAAAIQAGSTITHIKDFVQKREFEKADVDINDAVRDATELARFNLNKHNIELVLNLGKNLPAVHIDRTRVSQVVLNLVLNGIDAISSSEKPGRMLQIQTRADGDLRVQVTVVDSGDGVLPEQQEKIFDQFHTTKQKGLGLGLSISRSIVESHEGRLWCETIAGQGGVFRFTVPSTMAEQSTQGSGIAAAG
jgi:PAS domain S-box-containing protein